ncbi:hypothetical protein TNCV_4902671 [Trichonephila clavipes]|nr:hypothetical protein TNCV_4902671 [Trichonephila clavipes]
MDTVLIRYSTTVFSEEEILFTVMMRKNQKMKSMTAITLIHEGTLNSRRAASPLVSLVEKKENLRVTVQSQGVLSQNLDGDESNRTLIYMVLKERRTSSSLPR